MQENRAEARAGHWRSWYWFELLSTCVGWGGLVHKLFSINLLQAHTYSRLGTSPSAVPAVDYEFVQADFSESGLARFYSDDG